VKKTATIILATLAFGWGQSFFNMRGLGGIVPPADARTTGLGSPCALSPLNPGIWVTLNQTSLAASGLAGIAVGTQSGSSRAVGTVRPASAAVAAPLPLQCRALLGIDDRFNQDFDVWSESLPDTAYRRHVYSHGGIHALRAGIAKSLLGRFCLGLDYSHLLGGSKEEWRFEGNSGAYSTTDTIETDYAGNTFQAGASFQTSRFSIAALYEPAMTLTAHRLKHVHGVVADSVRTYRIRLPNVMAFGGGVEPTDKLGLSLGLDLRPWAGATLDDVDAGYRNTWRISAGAEYQLSPEYPLRIGYSRQTYYFDALTSDPTGTAAITEDGLYVGTSIPVPKFGSLDLSGSVLLRRADDLTEVAGRLMLTLSYRETWARRTRRWGY